MKKNFLFVKYYSYKIRLIRKGRRKKPFFQIVVVNSKNRFVTKLGYLNPLNSSKKIKPIGLNRNLTIFWLLKFAVPSRFVFFLYENVGLVKYNY